MRKSPLHTFCILVFFSLIIQCRDSCRNEDCPGEGVSDFTLLIISDSLIAETGVQIDYLDDSGNIDFSLNSFLTPGGSINCQIFEGFNAQIILDTDTIIIENSFRTLNTDDCYPTYGIENLRINGRLICESDCPEVVEIELN